MAERRPIFDHDFFVVAQDDRARIARKRAAVHGNLQSLAARRVNAAGLGAAQILTPDVEKLAQSEAALGGRFDVDDTVVRMGVQPVQAVRSARYADAGGHFNHATAIEQLQMLVDVQYRAFAALATDAVDRRAAEHILGARWTHNACGRSRSTDQHDTRQDGGRSLHGGPQHSCGLWKAWITQQRTVSKFHFLWKGCEVLEKALARVFELCYHAHTSSNDEVRSA